MLILLLIRNPSMILLVRTIFSLTYIFLIKGIIDMKFKDKSTMSGE